MDKITDVPNFEVVTGTYEEYLLGYKLSSTDKGYNLTQSFATHGHAGSIRTVTQCGKYLASGGSDDRITVYDMVTRKEHCMLTYHDSTVNCLAFTVNHTHLISGSADGVLSIVRVGNWQLEKKWEKAHKGSAVLSIAVHNSGKLALTLGTDCVLRTWNLIKGRQAYAINLSTKSADAKSLDTIEWQPDGENFLLAGGHHLEQWSISKGALINKRQWSSKVTSVCCISNDIIAVGLEDGKITLVNSNMNDKSTVQAHEKRVKCLKSRDNWLVSASSSGHIKVWHFDGKEITEVSTCNTGCRITCLALVKMNKLKEENNEIITNVTERKIIPVQKQKPGVVIVEMSDDSESDDIKLLPNKKTHKKNKVKKRQSKDSTELQKTKRKNNEKPKSGKKRKRNSQT